MSLSTSVVDLISYDSGAYLSPDAEAAVVLVWTFVFLQSTRFAIYQMSGIEVDVPFVP